MWQNTHRVCSLGMVERFLGDEPRFWDFQSEWVYILYLNTIWLTPPLSAEKIGLSHLVPEILGPKVGVIFQQNVLFKRFSLHFRSNWPPFPLILIFLTPHFCKSLDPIGAIFCSCAVPGYRKHFNEVTPPPSPRECRGHGFTRLIIRHQALINFYLYPCNN